MTVRLDLRFDGLLADDHQLDMRRMGQTLVGLERVMSTALWLAVEGQLPKARQRHDLSIRVQAPRAACVEIPAEVGSAPGILPFIFEMIKHPGSKFLFEFLSFMLKWKGGKRKESDEHLMEAYRAAVEMQSALTADRQDERARFYANEAEWRAFALALADRMTPSLRQVVGPVGRDAETLTLASPAGSSTTVIDVPMAEAVRSQDALEVGDMMQMLVRVDGLIKHSRQLKVELESEPGSYVNADVRDPAFDAYPNIYTHALEAGEYLLVDAKPTMRDGQLFKLHIMNAQAPPEPDPVREPEPQPVLA